MNIILLVLAFKVEVEDRAISVFNPQQQDTKSHVMDNQDGHFECDALTSYPGQKFDELE
jgi:hypothetical protein